MAKIRDLPEEVLLLIFSFLKLRDRKVVARVSRLWNRLAFSDRPMRSISLHAVDYLNAKERKILLKSSRCYRNLTLEWTEASSEAFCVQVLDKFGSELTSLRLSTYVITLPLLVRFLLKTHKLRELIIEGSLCSEECDMVVPEFGDLRSLELTQRGYESELRELVPTLFPNLTSLDVVGAENASLDLIRFYSKQLKCLHVLLEGSQLQKFSELENFENLQQLNVHWPQIIDPKYSVACFQQMKNVKSASISGPVNEDTLLSISKWSQLTHLCINVQLMKASTFKSVADIKNLKSLKLQGSVREKCFLKDVRLLGVRKLILDGVSTTNDFYDHLASFVPHVTFLKIYDHTFENASLMLITKSMVNLQSLSLEYCYQVKDNGFQFLNYLSGLIELRCWSVPISENAFLRFPKCPNLRTFAVGGSGWITNKSVLDIPKAFPNLTELNVIDCFKVDEDTIYELRERMRKCAVVKLKKLEPDREAEAPWAKCW
ncbi:uncharacterized protein LOC6049075 [Culex quinquefasciatus]|uniref:uncharacterized protein LOC6049075 n=1 Tax=Culex quinquefasciatus TaxID=7176 RepID=UPI0018E3A5BF|nr:uncharacterized protein LOC6049075 [Culex quinquefasciatus]